MFKLLNLSISYFAIVKTEEKLNMPISVHGFIQVIFTDSYEFFALIEKDMMSKELIESGEIDSLKEKAIDLTKETVDEEFGD